ncbi:MAG: TRAP transporter large permease [Proteobacteria bacterium]|nr:TRAP transporter large permease [Pseudomonadota bacterium]MBU2518402.1 TRAP transporter large permease [Pseudomonadota bacterium]
MSVTLIAIVALVAFLGLLMVGVPIGIAMGAVGFLGIWFIRGFDACLMTLCTIPYSAIASWSLSVIPMFLLMGFIGFNAGFTRDAYLAAYRWLGRLPGGVAIATLFGGAGFGACSGSSIAATAALGKIAVPEMERIGYNPKLACGSAAVAGTLAALIPPSILLVIYGIVTEQSIGKLLIAGIIPGILSVICFSGLIVVQAILRPADAPKGERASMAEKINSLKYALPLLLLFIIVVAGIYGGIFTPTEAGAVGASAILLISLVIRRMTWHKLKESFVESIKVTCSIFVIVLGAYIFIQFLSISRLPINFSEWVVTLPIHRIWILLGVLGLYLILGCFLDALGLILLTVPFIFPAIEAMGFNPIWFGIIVVKMVEIGLLTPPVGIQSYVLKGVVPHIPLGTIFAGILPFFLVDLFIVIGLMILFPDIVLFLPNQMTD